MVGERLPIFFGLCAGFTSLMIETIATLAFADFDVRAIITAVYLFY